MKKGMMVLLAALMIVSFTACSASKEKGQSVFDKIQESAVAFMESSDGVKVCVWNTQDLASLSSFRIEETSIEPADKEKDWLYRITYNPKDMVRNCEEITVFFYNGYIQIGSEFYTAKQGADFDDILDWAEWKFEYLVNEYGAE